MNLKQVVSQKYQFLLKRLDSSHEFFGGLQRNEVLQQKLASITEQPTPTDKTNALLSALLDVRDDLQDSVMGDVIEALRSSGQAHIANVFRGVSDSDKVPMTDEHHLQLQVKTAELCNYMDPNNELLVQLFSAKVISCSEVERIRFSSGRNEMIRKLIEIFMKKSDDTFEKLIKALEKVGQTHVAYILTGNGNARPLNRKLRDKLMLNRVNLIESIYFNGLVSVLMSKRVFSEYDQQHVESRRTEKEKIEKTLDLIARKSQLAFGQFIVALCETSHEHVVVEMMGTEITAKVVAIIDANASKFCTANLENKLLEMMQKSVENGELTVDLTDALNESETSFTGVEEGSIIVKFRCKNVEALQELHRSETLDKLFTEAFCRPLAHKGLSSIRLEIAKRHFEQCAEKFKALKLMTPEHREALVSSAKFLVAVMTVNDDLLDKLSLCRQRRQAIETAATHEERVKMLLDIVSRQPDSAFTQLLDALRDTQQEQSAFIIRASLLNLIEEETLSQQPKAAWKMAKDSMRHLISKFHSIDDETATAISNLQTSLSAMRQVCGTAVQRPHAGESKATEPQKVDANNNNNNNSKSLEETEVTAIGRTTAKPPMPVDCSTPTSLEENRLIATENRKSATDVAYFRLHFPSYVHIIIDNKLLIDIVDAV